MPTSQGGYVVPAVPGTPPTLSEPYVDWTNVVRVVPTWLLTVTAIYAVLMLLVFLFQHGETMAQRA